MAQPGGFVFPIRVSREDFEEAISGFIQQTEMLCEEALELAGVQASTLEGVLLAGGSTRIPCVRESVQRVFGREPDTSINPDEVVALGAAVQAALRCDPASLTTLQREALQGVELREKLTRSYGIVEVDSSGPDGEQREVNRVIIPLGTNLPCSVTRSYYTTEPNQRTFSVTLTECHELEQRDLQFATVVGKVLLELPPGRPAGQRIDVTYSIGENGVLHAEYTDVASGKISAVALPFVMPAGVPVGTELWTQWAIQDAAAIKGVALSNAVLGLTR
jgi:molecular chaperone DnaK (HSP70)